MSLSPKWDNEAYVSVHLVQEMLIHAGIPKKLGSMSCWHPEFRIKMPKIDGSGFTEKKVDFLIEDHTRHVNFLIEIKSAKQRISDAARFQLVEKYLYRSNIKFGVLIDPFSIEIYEYGQIQPKATLKIEDPNHIEPIANFLKKFLETLKMRTIAIHTSKGGVGKTTLTINMAYELAKQGNRVLVVDLDDQANASLSLGVNKADEIDAASSLKKVEEILDSFEDRQELIEFLLECVLDDFDYRSYIYPSSFNSHLNRTNDGFIDVLPGSYKTQPHELERKPFADNRLNKGLQKLAGKYDYCLIDTPPTYNRITWNGIYAAQYIVIPSQMEYLSVYGIRNPIKQTREVREDTEDARAVILGIVPMMTDNTKINKTVLKLVKKTFDKIPILPELKRATDIREASHQRIPLSLLAENKPAAGSVAKQMANLTHNVVEKINSLETK